MDATQRKRVDELLAEPALHRSEITAIGQRFGIVTPETSLIVLETLADYRRYGLTPPPGPLRDAFDAGQRATVSAKATQSRQHLGALVEPVMVATPPSGIGTQPPNGPEKAIWPKGHVELPSDALELASTGNQVHCEAPRVGADERGGQATQGELSWKAELPEPASARKVLTAHGVQPLGDVCIVNAP